MALIIDNLQQFTVTRDISFLAPRPGDTMGLSQTMVNVTPTVGSLTPQPSFCYRSVWIPLVINVYAIQGSHKAVL